MPKNKIPEQKESAEESKVRSVGIRLGDRAPEGNVWYADVSGFSDLVAAGYNLGLVGNKILSVQLEQRKDSAYAVVTYE